MKYVDTPILAILPSQQQTPHIQVKFEVNPRLIFEKNKKKSKKLELHIFINIRKT